jgi:hypothetical protein
VQLPIVDKFRGTVADRVKFGLFCSKKSDKDWGFPISIFLKLSENPQNTKIRYNPIAATARCKEEQ